MQQIVSLSSSDERQINLRAWVPDAAPERVIVLSHGMGEHIDRYRGFAEYCCRHNLVMLGANHRGHGQSAPVKGHFADDNGWHKVLDDLDRVVDYARQTYGLPVTLIGHSMGSFVARHYAMLHGDKLASLVLCGSDQQSAWLFKLGKWLAKHQVARHGQAHPSKLMERLSFGQFNRAVKLPRTDMDWLSRDSQQVDKYLADPLCGFTCSAQFWVDFMSGLQAINTQRNARSIPSKLPVYVVSGEADPVSRMGKGARDLQCFLRKAGLKRVELKLYPDARHELFNELNKEQFYADTLRWVGQY